MAGILMVPVYPEDIREAAGFERPARELGPIRYTLTTGANVREVMSQPVLRQGRLIFTRHTLTVDVPVGAAPAPAASPWEEVQPGAWRHRETKVARFQKERPEC